MAQFDTLIIFPILWSLILTLVAYYIILIKLSVPNFWGVKKFRNKKLDSQIFTSTFFNLNNYSYIF